NCTCNDWYRSPTVPPTATCPSRDCSTMADSRLPNFRALTPAQRLDHIADAAGLSADEKALLSQPGALPVGRADGMIENVIGTFELPFGVAGNFQINGQDVLVPMAVEEPSIVAAASFMAKLAREGGGF